ncbi:MAG: hypothetical protein ABMA13_20350 [Chthoniobacteraceae bacterium]
MIRRTFLVLALLAARVVAAEFGDQKYIEYLPGDLPLVISAPHGGREEPAGIPSREKGVLQPDTNTQELAREIADEIVARTGHRAHFIISRLHRKKLDPNREIAEAAAGSPIAEKAWSEYHAFIEKALTAAIAKSGKVFFIDLHGQNHRDRRIELGYLHSQETLAETDAALDSVAAEGSLRRIAEVAKVPYSALVRGPRSLGALLEARGFPCTPSPERPTPFIPYFQGGYTVRRHVDAAKPIAGLQIEANLIGVRDTAANRTKFTTALVAALREYLAEHFDLRLPTR